jgi:hypothetical protein
MEQNLITSIGSKWIKMVFMIFNLFISHLLHHHTFVPHEHKEHITNYELIVFVFIPCLLSILKFCFKTWFKSANYQYKIPWNPWSVTQTMLWFNKGNSKREVATIVHIGTIVLIHQSLKLCLPFNSPYMSFSTIVTLKS